MVKRIRTAAAVVADRGLKLAAGAYTGRAVVLDLAGGFAGVVAAAHVGTGWAWGFASVWLTLRAGGLDRKVSK